MNTESLTAVITLGAVNESFWSPPLVGLFTLLANATYSIGNDLRLQGQNNAINTTSIRTTHDQHGGKRVDRHGEADEIPTTLAHLDYSGSKPSQSRWEQMINDHYGDF